METWLQRRDIVGRVLFIRHGVTNGHGFNQIDVDAVHLLEREAEIEIRLFVRGGLELPAHHIGREPLRFRRPGGVELGEFGETPIRARLNPRLPVDARFGRKLTLQPVLFFAAEIARGCGQARAAANPLIREIAKEVVDAALLGGSRENGEQERAGDCKTLHPSILTHQLMDDKCPPFKDLAVSRGSLSHGAHG